MRTSTQQTEEIPARRRASWVALIAATCVMTGCVNMGPKAVQAGRADYNAVLRDTTDEQLLSNLVRLQYRDRPYFLEVSAVTTQYSFTPEVSALGALGPSNVEQELLAGGRVEYSETPTISYVPLQGEDFARRLLTPVSLDSLLLLSNSGWSVERLLRMCVQRINGIPNAVTASGPTPDTAPEYRSFREVARLFRELQLTGHVMVGYAGGEGEYPLLIFDEQARQSTAYDRFTRLLGLDTDRDQFRLVPGIRRAGGDTITIHTRSLNGVLYYLAHGVNIPDTHRSRGLVTETLDETGTPFDWGLLMDDLFRVNVGESRPQEAAVGVRYRGHWYYIDDADLSSKSTFSLLSQLFTLQAGSGGGQQPVLTIPVGQ